MQPQRDGASSGEHGTQDGVLTDGQRAVPERAEDREVDPDWHGQRQHRETCPQEHEERRGAKPCLRNASRHRPPLLRVHEEDDDQEGDQEKPEHPARNGADEPGAPGPASESGRLRQRAGGHRGGSRRGGGD